MDLYPACFETTDSGCHGNQQKKPMNAHQQQLPRELPESSRHLIGELKPLRILSYCVLATRKTRTGNVVSTSTVRVSTRGS